VFKFDFQFFAIVEQEKGIQPVKSSASKPLGMAVNVSGCGLCGDPTPPAYLKRNVWRVLACPMSTVYPESKGG